MDIQAEKVELIKMILETNNPRIIQSIKKVFKKSKKSDFWESLSQEKKDEILKGIDEVKEGEVLDYDDFMKKHR